MIFTTPQPQYKHTTANMSTLILNKDLIRIVPRVYTTWHREVTEELANQLHAMYYRGESEICTHTFKLDINLRMVLTLNSCTCTDGEDCKYFDAVIEMGYKDDIVLWSTIVNHHSEWVSPSAFKTKFENTFKLEYKFCLCGFRAYHDDKCDSCYIYDYTHSEHCSICFENGHRWVQLHCNHVFHVFCVATLLKCPLCRAPINPFAPKKNNQYPFNFN